MTPLHPALLLALAGLLAAAEPVETVTATVVDFGQDAVREGDGAPLGSTFGVCRFRPVVTDGVSGPSTVFEQERTEVDGDPATGDVAGFYRFSLDQPLTPDAPWYDAFGRSSRMYGGACLETANAEATRFHECGVNNAVEGGLFAPRDNWSFFYEHFDYFSPFRIHLVFLWPKAGFLNGGAEGRVDLGEDAVASLYLQRYFMGVDGVRVVVQDAEGFWISEQQWRGCNGSGGRLHRLRLGDTAWARYAPAAPRAIAFAPDGAVFARRSFRDVQAVGFHAAKRRLSTAFFGFKFYAFEVAGTVTRPRRPSQTLEMATVAAPGLPAFHLSRGEIRFRVWNRVRQDASDNCFADLRGVSFDREGMAGSQDLPGPDGRLLPHGPDEPVTGITLHDAALWCNALSRLESRTPCYYLDADCREVFTAVVRSPAYVEPRAHPPLFVKWDADGYRLPTLAEWAAAGPAGGVADLTGGVWEFIWPDATAYDPATAPVTVVGGDARGAAAPTRSASGWSEEPWGGLWNIGVRVLRREAGAAAPPPAAAPGIPRWSFRRGERLPGAEAPPAAPAIALVAVPAAGIEAGATEVDYQLWWQVRSWAEARGYVFDQRGQMGSMAFRGYAPWGRPGGHAPSEPVTGISGHDARVWCNALSAWLGRQPVYYEDEALAKPLRQSCRYRPLQLIPGERGPLVAQGVLDRTVTGAVLPVLDPQADGFRLPTAAEFAALLGEGPRPTTTTVRCFDSAGGSTHPVGGLPANAAGFHDLLGNVAEWCEDRPNPNDRFNNSRIGGSFLDFLAGCGTRPYATQTTWRYPDVGLRVVRRLRPAGR